MYSSFIRLHPTPVWLTELSTLQIVDVSPGAAGLFGLDRSVLLGMLMETLCAPEDLPELHDHFEQLRRGTALCRSFRFVTRSIGIVDVATSWLPVEVDGQPHVLNIIHDETALIAAQARLRIADDLLRIAGQMAQCGGWRVDPVERVLHITEQTAAILKMPGQQSLTIDDGMRFVAPEDQQKGRDTLKACLTDGTPFDEMMFLVSTTGMRVRVRVLGEAIRDADGRICGAQGALQSIDHLAGERDCATMTADRLHRTLDSMAEGFIALDAGLRAEYLNQRAETMLGKRRDAAIEMHLIDLLPEASAAECCAAATRAMAQSTNERMNVFFAPAAVWYRLDFVPTAEGVAIYVHDITADMAHAKRLSLMEAVVDGQPDMLEISEVTEGGESPGRLIYVNAAFERESGYKADEVLGLSPIVHSGPLTNPAELARVKAAINSGTKSSTEVENLRKDGSAYQREADLWPIRDIDGRITNWAATSRDVTERRRVETALRDSEERFRLAALVKNDVVWDRDIKLNRTWWDAALFRIFGYDNTAPHVQSPDWWWGLVHPQDAARVVSSFDASLAGRDTTWAEAYSLRRSDGEYVYVKDRAHISRDIDGRAVRVIGCVTDVTEEVELAAEAAKAQMPEEMAQWSGTIAHDFNNLLTVIIGNAELLVDDPEISPQHSGMAEKVLIAAERGSKLISKFTSFASKQEAGPQKTDLNFLLRIIEPELRGALSEGQTLRIIAGPELWPAVIDRHQFTNSVLALVRNSADAMPPDGTLTIETGNHRAAAEMSRDAAYSDGECYVQMTVRENGHGILPEHIDRISEPLFTTRPNGMRKVADFSAVYGFVERCGGFIEVESPPGLGASLHLYFPRAGLSMSDGAIGRQRDKSRGHEHILLVEDEPLVSAFVRGQIEDLGYRVTVAANAAEALALLRVHLDVDLLFTDIVMPGGMNGLQLAEAVAHLRPEVKVLLTSGYADAALAQSGAPAPGVRLLKKPYHRQELGLTIRAVLDT